MIIKIKYMIEITVIEISLFLLSSNKKYKKLIINFLKNPIK
jgi:hypothetical protein